MDLTCTVPNEFVHFDNVLILAGSHKLFLLFTIVILRLSPMLFILVSRDIPAIYI